MVELSPVRQHQSRNLFFEWRRRFAFFRKSAGGCLLELLGIRESDPGCCFVCPPRMHHDFWFGGGDVKNERAVCRVRTGFETWAGGHVRAAAK